MTVMNGDDPGNAPRELRESTKTHLSHSLRAQLVRLWLARLLRTCDHDTRVTAPRPLRPLLFRTVGATTPLNPTTGRAAAAHRTGGLES